jgi:hypothetical protein
LLLRGLMVEALTVADAQPRVMAADALLPATAAGVRLRAVTVADPHMAADLRTVVVVDRTAADMGGDRGR